MSTGIETWNQNLLDIGPMYPFAGAEGLLAIIGIGSWIAWHVIQIRSENKLLEEEAKSFADKEKLKRAVDMGKAGTLLDQHTMNTVKK